MGQRTTLGYFMFVAAMTLLFAAGCDDNLTENVPAPALNTDLFLSVLDGLTEDDVVDVARSVPVAREGRLVLLGDGYYANVSRPDFVHAWVMATAFDGGGPDPDCKGTGLGFAKCVKRHLDNGEECTVHKEGDEYHAHREESLSSG